MQVRKEAFLKTPLFGLRDKNSDYTAFYSPGNISLLFLCVWFSIQVAVCSIRTSCYHHTWSKKLSVLATPLSATEGSSHEGGDVRVVKNEEDCQRNVNNSKSKINEKSMPGRWEVLKKKLRRKRCQMCIARYLLYGNTLEKRWRYFKGV